MKLVTTTSGDVVKVTNTPTVTLYYRGRYYRTQRTVSTTPRGFRMITTSTFIYATQSQVDELRWFWAEDERMVSSHRYDDSRLTESVPF